MEHEQNPFDKQIKETYEGHQDVFDQNSWDELNQKLDHLAPSPLKYFASLTTGIAAAGLIFLSLLYLLSNEGQSTIDTPPQVVELKTAEGNGNRSNEAVTDAANVATKMESSELVGDDVASGTVESVIELAANQHGNASKGSSSEIKSPTSSEERGIKNDNSAVPNKILGTKPETTVTKKIGNDAKITGSGASNNRMVHTSCKGLTIQFEASKDYGQGAKFLWNFGDGFFSNEVNPSHTFNKSGTFDVSLSVTSHTTGQITSNVVQASIEVLEAPRARTLLAVVGPVEFRFENASMGDDNTEWHIDGSPQGSGNVAIVPFADKTENQIQLVVLNQSGCADTLTQYLSFSSAKAAVTLNKENARFIPEMSGELYIFSAGNGKLVYSSEEGGPWDASGEEQGDYTFLNIVKGKEKVDVTKGSIVVE